jgi:hypothetical protein
MRSLVILTRLEIRITYYSYVKIKEGEIIVAGGGEVNVGFGGEIEGKRPFGSYGIILKWVVVGTV